MSHKICHKYVDSMTFHPQHVSFWTGTEIVAISNYSTNTYLVNKCFQKK